MARTITRDELQTAIAEQAPRLLPDKGAAIVTDVRQYAEGKQDREQAGLPLEPVRGAPVRA